VEGILPRILRYGGDNLCPPEANHFGEGPIPPGMMSKAVCLLQSSRNYRKVHQGRASRNHLVTVLFNSKKHSIDVPRLLDSEIDSARSMDTSRARERDLLPRFSSCCYPSIKWWSKASRHRVTLLRNRCGRGTTSSWCQAAVCGRCASFDVRLGNNTGTKVHQSSEHSVARRTLSEPVRRHPSPWDGWI
jgi:hypothetical protein